MIAVTRRSSFDRAGTCKQHGSLRCRGCDVYLMVRRSWHFNVSSKHPSIANGAVYACKHGQETIGKGLSAPQNGLPPLRGRRNCSKSGRTSLNAVQDGASPLPHAFRQTFHEVNTEEHLFFNDNGVCRTHLCLSEACRCIFFRGRTNTRNGQTSRIDTNIMTGLLVSRNSIVKAWEIDRVCLSF